MIVCGDFNNTAYSYVYKEIKGDLQDAFVEAGNGFGRTFNFKFFPIRIDFILADQSFDINAFKTFDVELSDQYPIMANVKLYQKTVCGIRYDVNDQSNAQDSCFF
jgi:endonuclease/exonuclease/phosphatase family metal-dependent hydrolase